MAGSKRLCLCQQRHKSAVTNNHESNLVSPIYYVFFVQCSESQYVHNGGVVCVRACVLFRCFITSALCGHIFRDPILRLCKNASHFPYIPPAAAVAELCPGHCWGRSVSYMNLRTVLVRRVVIRCRNRLLFHLEMISQGRFD